MKIGKLEFKEYAAKKPLMIGPVGEYLKPADVLKQPGLALGSLHALKESAQIELAVERYSMEPDFKLGILGVGLLTKTEVIDHLKRQDDLGQLFLQAEMRYCNELVASLQSGTVTVFPKIPARPLPKIPDWRPVKKCINLKVPTRALFCENTTDPVTTPFANYRIANVHPAFAQRGFRVVCLQGVDDVRSNFVPEAKNTLTTYLGGIGHGAYPIYTGHMGNHILEVCTYSPAEVQGKAIHLLSCQTAKELGPDAVAKGALCYAGYIENFILQWDDSNTPVDEFLLFARSDSTFDLMMANGATGQQAYEATVQAFNASIAQVPNTVAATYLTLDRDRLKLIGNGAAIISPFRLVRVCFPLATAARENALAAAGEVVE